LFAAFDAVRPRYLQRVVKHELGGFKAHAVLAQIGRILPFVLREQV
jgi:hypothetical protein